MKISIHHLIQGAQEAEGLTVIIDVFRAFSLECYLYANHAKLIIPVSDLDKALELGRENPDYILIGERDEKKVNGFHYGNSPKHILAQDFSGKTIVHTTSAGTQGIIQATNASEIITGTFVNALAIARYIQQKKPFQISLVCMGYSAMHQTEEDTLCAELIYNLLRGKESNYKEMVEIIRNTSGRRFFEPAKSDYCPSEDFDLCLDLNRFNFVIKAEKQRSGLIYNIKIENW
jgi:2-phosphosulfolactate phosphatase